MESEQSFRWRSLLQAQSSVISRQQAREGGWSESAVDRRLRSGAWQRLQRGAYATFSGGLSREATLWAAVLRAGPGAVLSHETAAGGVHSPLERSYVHGAERAHELPAAERQAKRRDGSATRYLDNLCQPCGLCVELDGAAAHPAEGRWTGTHRDNATLVQGARTLRYSWLDVTAHRCQTAAQIAAALRRGGWTGTLRPCGPACTAAGPACTAAGPAGRK